MSLVLDAEDVDDGYFTPVASTTLASIFKDDSNNDAAVNPTLKYRPPRPKKTGQSSNSYDSHAPQYVFSCSVIGYEWEHGTHKCLGKVGIAMIKIIKTGLCKIILYSPDKSTLSCTTIVPQLEVTLKGTMISLYDDKKKYWSLCFNEKTIEQITEVLKGEKVTIKKYVSPDFKSDMETIECDEANDESDSNNMIEDNTPISRNDKASILNRIANVGHAILPSLPDSPTKKTSVDTLSTPEECNPGDKFNILPNDKNNTNNPSVHDQDLTKSIAIQTTHNNDETGITLPNNIKQCTQKSITTLPLINNQIFTYVNGYMVPLHMQVPVMSNAECADTSAEFEFIIQKLTHLKAEVKAMEMRKCLQKDETGQAQTCTCKKPIDNLTNATTIKNYDKLLKRISELEQVIKEKDEIILKFQNDVQKEIKKNQGKIQDQQLHIKELKEIIEKSKKELHTKREQLKLMTSKKESDMILSNTVKILMTDTFRSLASKFESGVDYSGDNIRLVLAEVIKEKTVETLNSLFTNQITPNISYNSSN